MRLTQVITVLLIGLIFVGVYGCSSRDVDSDTPQMNPAENMENMPMMHDQDEAAMEKMMSGMKSLSVEDQKSAMAQRLCPVSGELLGSMGAPIKIDVDGEAVWICCAGCKKKLLADPAKYLGQNGQTGGQPAPN